MARVHEIDPNLIERTRTWLLNSRNTDGSWSPENRAMHDNPTSAGQDAHLSATAYIAWSVFANGNARAQSETTRAFLLKNSPDQITDPYVLALVCNALLEIDKDAAAPYVEKLDSLKQQSNDGKTCWWKRSAAQRTVFYGAGQSGTIETTALATLATIKQGSHPATARSALAWLITQKDSSGTWHSTQATVLALRALLAATTAPLGSGQSRHIELLIDGHKQDLQIPADQDEVMRQVDLSSYLKPGGAISLDLHELSNTGVGYQVNFRYNVPTPASAQPTDPLTITLNFDRTEVAVGDKLQATATITNHQQFASPMVIVTLPIPAGFSADDNLKLLRQIPSVEKVQITPRTLVVYLRSLAPQKPLELKYQLKANTPASVTIPPANIYEYYDPAKRAQTPERKVVIADRA
jgi:uncharacterized protein YfaS (alpha-2-macroglobulin family)